MDTVVLGFWFCFGIVVGLFLYPRLANVLAALGRWVGQLGMPKPSDRVTRGPEDPDRR
jgi:hypothetical protein